MAAENEVEAYINEAREAVKGALEEMTEVNIVRENDATDFPLLQQKLEDLFEQASHLAVSYPEHETEIREAQHHIKKAHRDMVDALHSEFGDHF